MPTIPRRQADAATVCWSALGWGALAESAGGSSIVKCPFRSWIQPDAVILPSALGLGPLGRSSLLVGVDQFIDGGRLDQRAAEGA
jgi:hypothetical protein